MKAKVYILCLLLFVLVGCKKNKKQPNVLFIAIDDLNDWVGALEGHHQAITPNMDRLFQRGILFTNAHCSQAVSAASRNSLLSGLHPATTGWYDSTTEMEKSYDQIMQGNYMIPEYFKRNGYKTYCSGKIFNGGESDYPDKTADFWDAYSPHFWEDMEPHIKESGYGYRGYMFYPFPKDGGQLVQTYGTDTINNHYRKTQRFYSLCGGPLSEQEIPAKGMYDEQIAEWAVNKLSEKHDDPFFMAVGFLRPHVPYTAPQKYFDLYDKENIKMPEVPEDEMNDIPLMGKAIAFGFTPQGCWYDINRREQNYKEIVHAYLACVSFVDDQIGKVVNALEASGEMDNTVIVLWSDNGQHLGEKHHFRKQALWEEATHIPLFFKAAGKGKSNAKVSTPVSLLDIYPTLVELCGLPANDKNQGNSLVPLINDPACEWDKPVLSVWKYKNFAVRSEDWRYIQYRDGSEELYNHVSDPGEHINLAGLAEYKPVIEAHKKYVPADPALPIATKEWKGDGYERRMNGWAKKDSIPVWLR